MSLRDSRLGICCFKCSGWGLTVRDSEIIHPGMEVWGSWYFDKGQKTRLKMQSPDTSGVSMLALWVSQMRCEC